VLALRRLACLGHPLSLDLRKRAVSAVDGGLSRRQAAACFSVSAARVIRWCQRRKASGSVAPARQGGDHKSQRIEAHADFIPAEVAATPDITLEELRTKLIEALASRFGLTTIWRFFDRRGITYKKDSARRRTAARGCERGARGLVRGPARSRSRQARLHRRDGRDDQDGAPARASAKR
jgi:transposase